MDMDRSMTLRLIGGAALLVMAACREPRVPPQAQAVLDEWLRTTCTVGEGNRLEAELRKFGRELEQPLIDVFEKGPPAADIARVETAARRQYHDIRAALRSGPASPADKHDAERVLARSADEHVRRAREDYIEDQRSAALVGLAVIGSSKARRTLERVAGDRGSEYQKVAATALSADKNKK